jgi:hypothetical protein
MDDKDFDEKISIRISLADFICPISEQIFFNPIQAMPCGHFFEEEELKGWEEKNDTCPYCREKIEEKFPTPPYFNRQLTELLERNPKLYDECYFNVETFSKNFSAYDEKKIESKPFKKMLHVLENSSVHFNNALPLLMKKPSGMVLLTNHPALRQKITAKSLNKILDPESGISVLYLLAESAEGRKLLINDGRLRSLIEIETLHARVLLAGENTRKSAAFWLKKYGKDFWKIDPILRAKLFQEEKHAFFKPFCRNVKEKLQRLEAFFKR